MRTRAALVVLLFMSFVGPLVQAQLSNATVQGTITSSDGAALPQAAVELTNLATGEHRTTHSNSSGTFEFAGLAPGNYKVGANAPGFAPWEGSLILRVGQNAEVNPSLKVGSVNTSVTVADVTPVINVANATLSDVKEATQIETLPLVDRNFLNILNFSPGVVAGSFGGQGGGYTRVNGVTGGSTSFFVDGQSVNDRNTNELQVTPQAVPTIQELKVTTSNGSAEYGTPGVVDVVSKGGSNQFHGQVYELYKTGGFQAKPFNNNGNAPHLAHNEFGGQLGGPVFIPKLYNGRNKTFFFFDVERTIEHSFVPEALTVPLASWRAGDFSDFVDQNNVAVKIYDPATTRIDPTTGAYVRDQFPGNVIPSGRISPIAQKVFAQWPLPNIAGANYLTGTNYQNPAAFQIDNITRYTSKVDQVLGQGLLSGRYTYVNQPTTGPKPNFLLLNPRETHNSGSNATLAYTRPFGANLVNELRTGVQVFQSYTGPVPITPSVTQSLGLPSYQDDIAWPGIYPGQYNGDPINTAEPYFDGIDRDNPKNAPNQGISIGDNLSWNRGKHELKFGFAVANTRVNTYETGQPGGNYGFTGAFTALQDPAFAASSPQTPIQDTGSSFADIFLGLVDESFLNTVPHYHTRQTDYDAFVQDNWKLTPRLTVNLGLRYEYWTPFNDASGVAATLNFKTPITPTVVYPGKGNPNIPSGVYQGYLAAGLPLESSAQAGLPSSLWSMDKYDFAPRVGFAYQPDPKSVIRGGYGIYYWTMPLVQYQQNTRHNVPFAYQDDNFLDSNNPAAADLGYNQASGSRDWGIRFNNDSGTSIKNPGGTGFPVAPWNTNFKSQRVQQYSLTLERALPYSWSASLSYVGNHGDHLIDDDPINALTPRALSQPGATVSQRRAYPLFSTSSINTMDLFTYIGYSNHNQMTAQVNHMFQKSFVFQSYFTWSQTLTTSEGQNNSYGALEIQPAALTNNAPQAQRLRAIYARDSELPALTFGINGHAELPVGQGKRFLGNTNGLVSRVISGWNTSAFYSWRNGLPFNPFYSANPNGGASLILAPGKTGALPSNQQKPAHWFDASIYDPTTGAGYAGQTFIRRTGTDPDFLSNIPRSYLTGPHFYDMDGSLYKLTPLTEHVTLDLELQVFNVFNHQNLDLPNNQGVITKSIGTPRQLQFQGKITF